MQKYTFEKILTNTKIQREFLKQIDRIIKLAKKQGYVEAVIAHSANRKILVEAIELYSPTKQETIAIIRADYDESQPETFRGYTVNSSNRFQTLDKATEYAASIAEVVMTSSTVDNYESDFKYLGVLSKSAPQLALIH